MHNYSLRQFGRTILTIAGIILLVIFGSRAASQATSLSAVGGQTKHSQYPIALTASQLVAIAGTETQHDTAGAYGVAILDSSASGNLASDQGVEDNNAAVKIAGQVKQAASQLIDGNEGEVSNTIQAIKPDKSNTQQTILQTDVK